MTIGPHHPEPLRCHSDAERSEAEESLYLIYEITQAQGFFVIFGSSESHVRDLFSSL